MTRRQQYMQYLASEQWKALRSQVFARDKACTQCGSRHHFVAHHLKYPKKLGEETLDMLTTLCESCHNILHGGSPRASSLKEKKKLAKKLKRARKTNSKTIRRSGPVKIFTEIEKRCIERDLLSRE